jgi:hypothetical protein
MATPNKGWTDFADADAINQDLFDTIFADIDASLFAKGATGSRPASPDEGDQYIDTTLLATHGNQIWYDGAAWRENIDKKIWTAKGQILAASASGAVAPEGVGANNTVLVADSSQTRGIRWAATLTATAISGLAQMPTVVRDTTGRTTTSTSYINIVAATISITPRSSSSKILLLFVTEAQNSGTNQNWYQFHDGTTAYGEQDYNCTTANVNLCHVIIGYYTGLTGSQTFTVQWKTNGGTATSGASTLVALEIP